MKVIKNIFILLFIFFVVIIIWGSASGDSKNNVKNLDETKEVISNTENIEKKVDNTNDNTNEENVDNMNKDIKIKPLIQYFLDIKEGMTVSQVKKIVKNNEYIETYDRHGVETSNDADIKEMDIPLTGESYPMVVVIFENEKVISKKYVEGLLDYAYINYKGIDGIGAYESGVMYENKDSGEMEQLAIDKDPTEVEKVAIEIFNN